MADLAASMPGLPCFFCGPLRASGAMLGPAARFFAYPHKTEASGLWSVVFLLTYTVLDA
jgi:hypothetical protein